MVPTQRASGILLHPSSLPGKHGIGSLGAEAYRFVDWLQAAGQAVWQMLPLGPTDWSHSPYQSYSAFAGNPDLIDLDLLAEAGLLSPTALQAPPAFPTGKIDFKRVIPYRESLLLSAYQQFKMQEGFQSHEYHHFWNEHGWWLETWSLFDACREHFPGRDWNKWDEPLILRTPEALSTFYEKLRDRADYSRFLQFQFFRQWFTLKRYANERGVSLFGDLPLYVSFNSADVWSNQSLFLLDAARKPTLVGGVPPDYFSATGQLWGNPLYDWEKMKEQGFTWWMARMHFNLRMFDLVRIDHFRGLESFWAVPAEEKTAIHGYWIKARGEEMLELLRSQIGKLPIVAEDLGLITPEVEQLRQKFELPGMKVLQFAFAGDAENTHLPHNYTTDFVAYTGTHDNNTTAGWLSSIGSEELLHVQRYFNNDSPDSWQLIRKAAESVAHIAIFPVQDLLNLPESARINKPGTLKGNWIWRMKPGALRQQHGLKIKELIRLYGRLS